MDSETARPLLSPCASGVLERARRQALFLHADELCLEHVFCALLEDERSAACQALLACFADPPSLAREALATANGILVVASHAALPFSTLGVRALFEAREAAARRGETAVTPARIALACLQHAPAPFRSLVLEMGLSAQALEQGLPPPGAGFEAAPNESIFRCFGGEAKQLLTVAARSAQAAGEASISPQRLLIAALGTTPELQAACGEAASKAQRLQPALLADATPAPERNLAREATLDEYLSRLSPLADTLDMLLALFRPPQSLLAQLLARQRLHWDELNALRGCFADAEPG